PYFENGAYKVAKLLDAATRPDSVRASHILLSAVTYPNPAERRQMADSLLQRVRSGQSSFGFLAGEISADSLSGAQGGDLGFFGPGNMVPEFEKAAFEGKVGEIKIVETQFGTHLLQINQQRNASRAVKIAVIDKPLEPSQATTRAVYAQANAFAGSIGGDLPFEEAAQQAGLVTRVAENVGPIDFFVPGLAEPREVIRWAFDAKLGEVSPLFDLNERYIVARLTEIRPWGGAPPEKGRGAFRKVQGSCPGRFEPGRSCPETGRFDPDRAERDLQQSHDERRWIRTCPGGRCFWFRGRQGRRTGNRHDRRVRLCGSAVYRTFSHYRSGSYQGNDERTVPSAIPQLPVRSAPG